MFLLPIAPISACVDILRYLAIANGVLEYTEPSAWCSLESMELSEDVKGKSGDTVFPLLTWFCNLITMRWFSLLYLLLNWDKMVDVENFAGVSMAVKQSLPQSKMTRRAVLWTELLSEHRVSLTMFCATLWIWGLADVYLFLVLVMAGTASNKCVFFVCICTAACPGY